MSACFIALFFLDTPAWKRVLDNVQWTVSFTAAGILAFLSFRASDNRPDRLLQTEHLQRNLLQKDVMRWVAFGNITYAAGQLIWNIQEAVHWQHFPAPSDVLFLMLPVGYLFGIAILLKGNVRRGEYRTAMLDAIILTTASVALVVSLYLPRRGTTGHLPMVIMIAFPVLFVAASSLLLITIVNVRPRLHLSWLLTLAGLLLNAVTWMIWNIRTLHNFWENGTFYTSTFTFAALFLGAGCIEWNFTPDRSARSIYLSGLLLRLLPILAVVASSVAIVVCITIHVMDPAVRFSIEAAAIVVIMLAIARQTLLVNEFARLSSLQTAILNNAGFGIIATDAAGIITAFNPHAEHMLGYRAEEMIGRKTPESFHDRQEMLQRAKEFSAKLGKTAIAGNSVFTAEAEAGLPAVHEWTYIRKDGSKLPVLLSVTRLLSASGAITGYLGVAADITMQKNAQRQLQESEAKFSAMFEFSPEILSLSRIDDQVFTDVNPAFEKLTGYSKAEVIGKRSDEFNMYARIQDRQQLYDELQRSGRVENHEVLLKTRHGKMLPVLVSLIKMKAGETEYLFGIGRDISALKAAERQILELNADLEQRVQERTAELAASNAELESFAYSVSHDLRSPLRGIDGFTRLLAESIGPQLNELQSRYIDRITSATKKMGEIIDGLLDLSKVTRTSIRRNECDITSLVRSWIADHASTLAGREVEWLVTDVPLLSADSRLVALLVDNLLANAVKYTKHRAKTVISFGTDGFDGNRIVLFVEDNGAGFDMADADRLFKPFQRLHRAEEFEGTGIGLATVHRVIQRHGGWIRAEGTVNSGTRITFALPAREKIHEHSTDSSG
ncbi:MAG TPA: PAS domain S-box protein [Steroidobacteraceae bacterium]|nr:PAS domain S-box protein [Steroidobacteraceae bacterium]